MAADQSGLQKQLAAARAENAWLKCALQVSSFATAPVADGGGSRQRYMRRLQLASHLGPLWTQFVTKASQAGDVATVVAPISAAVKHLQAATGADQAGCHAMLPRIASAYPTLGGDASPDDECVLISKHDVEVLTILLSHFASKRPRIARTSSGGALKATLQKKFSDRSDVFDEATQEYMLDLTETKNQAPLTMIQKVGRRVKARLSMRKHRGSIKNLLEGLSLLNRTNFRTLQAVQYVHLWEFDIFRARDKIGAIVERDETAKPGVIPGTVETLVAVSMAVFTRLGVLIPCGVEAKELRAYVRMIGKKYNGVPYHNALHAADVAQTTFYMLDKGGLATHMAAHQQFAVIWAALAHDVGHMALTNAFLVRSNDPLAIRYNDKSVLENMHAATAFETLRMPGLNFLEGAPALRKIEMRELVVSMILATDNAVHAAVLSEYTDRLARIGEEPLNLKESVKDCCVVFGVMLHCADVSNPAKQVNLYRRWTDLIVEEFYAQGDKEKELGLPVIAINNREKPVPLANMQAGFIHGLVMPLYTKFAALPLVDMSEPLAQLRSNLKMWEDQIHGRTPSPAPVPVSSGAGASAGAGSQQASPTARRPQPPAGSSRRASQIPPPPPPPDALPNNAPPPPPAVPPPPIDEDA